MAGTFDRRSPSRRARWLILCLGLLAAVLVHAPMMGSIALTTEGRFYDADSYMRLQRVAELHAHGRWYDAQTPRTNAPIGETLHWTRPLDAILLAGAWLGSAVTDHRDALELWGRLVSPVLLLVLVVVWYRGTRGLLSSGGFIMSVAILPLLPLFDMSFFIGRPDHHGLLNLLFVAGLVLMFRIVTETAGSRIALAAGALSGAAIWISAEAVATTAYFAAALALLWLWRGQPYLSRTVFFMVGLFATISLALFIERPPGQWTTPIYDSVSIVHWSLTGAGAIAWLAIAAAANNFGGDGTVRLRLAGVLAGALIPALVVAVVFPRFYLGPFADYDSVFFDRWLHSIAEYKAILPTSRERIAVLIGELGPVLAAVIYAFHRLRRGDKAERQLMALLLFGFACFVPLTLSSARWTVYAQALAWLPWTLAALALFNIDPKVAFLRQRIPLRMPAVGAFLTAPLLLALAITPTMPGFPSTVAPQCDWQQMAAYLNDRHAAKDGNELLLLTDIFRGPVLVWSTPYNVVGAPYGNGDSLNDTFGFFDAVDDRVPREIVARRNVDLILVCPSSAERRYYEAGGRRTMFKQLSDGVPPRWLKPVQLPGRLGDAFRLYSVSR